MRLTKTVLGLIVCAVISLQMRANVALSDATAYQNDPAHDGAATFAVFNPIPTPLWSTNVGGNFAYPLIAGSDVYVNAGTNLQAYNSTTGTLSWKATGQSHALFPAFYAPTYDNGNIFVMNGTSGVSNINQYNAITGAAGWSTTFAGQYQFDTAPTASNGIVYADGSGDGSTVYAVRETDGSLLWSTNLNGSDSTPAVTSDGVYVSYSGPQTFKLNPTTGAQIWHYNGAASGGGGSTPVVSGGSVYVSDLFAPGYNNNNFMSINSTTGASQYTTIASSNVIVDPPAFYNGIGYISFNKTIESFNLTDGSINWSQTITDGSTTLSAPLVVNGYVYEDSSAGFLYVLNGLTGATIDTINLGAPGATFENQGFNVGMTAANGLLAVPDGATLEVFALPEPSAVMLLMLGSSTLLLRRARRRAC